MHRPNRSTIGSKVAESRAETRALVAFEQRPSDGFSRHKKRRERFDMRFAAMVLTVALFASAAPGAQNRASQQTTFEVEQELLRLSNYGVFDFITFDVDRGTVTLDGYSYSGSLKSQATRAVKRVPGVDTVDNKIEQLPASPGDDRIRWATFRKIYGDGFLSRYAPEGEMGVRDELLRSRQFPGMQPFGEYPIHIIVKGGRTTLVGSVGSKSDKVMAEMRAREVSGVFSIENALVVDGD
jgi:hyperosmotically inducible periplasmic protein